MRHALTIDEAIYGNEHPNVAIRLNNLATLLQEMNRLIEAKGMLRRALSIDERACGNEHPNVATRLNNLAQLLQTTNRISEAEPLMRRALAILDASYGSEHSQTAIILNGLAQLLRATNRRSEAEPYSRRQMEIFLQVTRNTGYPHAHLLASINNYWGLLIEMGRTREEVIEVLREIAPEFFEQGEAEGYSGRHDWRTS